VSPPSSGLKFESGGRQASSKFDSTLKMDVTNSSETSVDFQGTTRHYTPESLLCEPQTRTSFQSFNRLIISHSANISVNIQKCVSYETTVVFFVGLHPSFTLKFISCSCTLILSSVDYTLNEEIHNLQSSPSRIIKSRRMRRYVARMGKKRNTYRILVGKPEGKRPLRRPTRRCEENIKMDLRETGWGDVDCIDLARGRGHWRALVNTAMSHRVP
jgi:hypothetical protein